MEVQKGWAFVPFYYIVFNDMCYNIGEDDEMKYIYPMLMLVLFLSLSGCTQNNGPRTAKMIDLSNKALSDVTTYADFNNLNLKIKREYSTEIDKDKIISQSIASDAIYKEGQDLTVTVSLGPVPISVYQQYKVNELGNVPIMMYHSIYNMKNDDTKYTGGNVDKDGYNRTAEAFRNDLEMYYAKGYRMVRLIDYMNGNIDVKLGKSPIVLTFDDGNKDAITVLGLDDNGNLIIDPNCVVGILESFKKKYPDFNVTATFFPNEGLFYQEKYNDKILKWLVDHGYDVGNHTKTHPDITKLSTDQTQKEVAYVYQLLDKVIPNRYVNIVALPYGSPYSKSNANFPYILKGNYDGYKYETLGTLRVGWDANQSPFSTSFDKTFMKRVRAWDNNGKEFDIEMVFKNLERNRYISDGDKNTIVITNDTNLNKEIKNKKIIKY